MSLSNHLENAMLNHLLGGADLAVPAIHVALSTADPGDNGAGLAEPGESAYVRVLHNDWSAAAGRAASNSSAIGFPQAGESWGLISHFALFDAGSGGNMLAHGKLTSPRQIAAGDVAQFNIDQINVRFSAGGFSDYLAHKLLDHVLGVASYTPPSIYVAISTASPADSGAGLAEPAAVGYARVAAAAWSAAANGEAENSDAITFAEAAEPWGTISHFAMLDAAESGNVLVHGPLAAARAVLAGDTARFAAGELRVTLD